MGRHGAPGRSRTGRLMLESMHIEHPDPESIASPLRALGADVDVRPGARVALVADISGPKAAANSGSPSRHGRTHLPLSARSCR